MEDKKIGEVLTEEFGRKYPHYADKIIISHHAAERILERFGKLNSQVGRAIIRAARKFKDTKKVGRRLDSTYKCQAVVTNRDSDDDKLVVVTVLFNN